ncbi:MAG: 16S rRNA (guanine(527)-N(7))-methyltransferase RsmG [Bacteroidota bacterium]|nr:16S rRNA (guanine(527)-N(7))-methyltransferase RsmG [Bacteroidota bacterium]
MNDEQLWLYTIAKKNGLLITDIQLAALYTYKTLLLDWNQKINLVSRKDVENAWKNHIAFSLTMLFKIEFLDTIKILDLGTGGGFPGIPLSMMLPHCSFLLLDSTQKKVAAVQAMIDDLKLPNANTVWGRAEELNRNDKYRNSFDAIVARSVSNLSNLLEWGMPFLTRVNRGIKKNLIPEKIGITTPSLITFKGGETEEEEIVAKKKFPNVKLQIIPLTFHGSEEFENHDKKLVIATL